MFLQHDPSLVSLVCTLCCLQWEQQMQSEKWNLCSFGKDWMFIIVSIIIIYCIYHTL